MLRTIDRPISATLRPCRCAASMICWTRWTCEAKHATMIRFSAVRKISSMTGAISRSLVTNPGTSALVESDISRSTPSAPSRAKAPRSVRRPSSGSWSILKSPVWSTSPAGVRIATARASGIEWFTAMNSQSNGPNLRRSFSATSTLTAWRRCSLSLTSTSPSVSRDPTIGMSRRSRSRYGTAPMWSSCAWVSTSASMSSRRPRM